MSKGTLYLIVGASGSGKDTLITHTARVLGRFFVPTKYTTRKPRKGEKQGREYYFVEGEEFRNLQLFVQYSVYDAQYGVGTKLLQMLEKGFDVLLNISNRLTEQIKKQYKKTKVIYIFVSLEKLRQRIQVRKRESEKEIEERIKRAKENLDFIGNVDCIINNNDDVKYSTLQLIHYIIQMRMQESEANNNHTTKE